MRDHPSVAGRVTTWALVLSLPTSIAPAACVAEEDARVAVADAFAGSGDASEVTVEYAWTISSPAQLWHLEAIALDGAEPPVATTTVGAPAVELRLR